MNKLFFTIFWHATLSIIYSQTINIESFASGFTRPLEMLNAGDQRLFVVEKGGVIKILNADGTTNPTPFLSITSQITTNSERGLLGMAFHPNYATNRQFFLSYTNLDGDSVVSRFETQVANPNLADTSSEEILLTIPQPAANHNGGKILFGPDGYLYIAVGDGGGSGDPNNNAQNLGLLLGKILRIDVNGGSPYSIPPDNPFAGSPTIAEEIWAYGLRNPWKISIDSSGNLWIADVGQGNIEEINQQPLTVYGQNYGWRCYEGNTVFNTSVGCPPASTLTFPVATYNHSTNSRCSITGGYVYEGTEFPNFTGLYFFADYCSNEIGTYNPTNQQLNFSERFTGNNFTSLGVGSDGTLYAVSDGGTIFKVVDSSLSIENPLKNLVRVYPNPVSGSLTIEVKSPSTTIKNYQLTDITGKNILSKPATGLVETIATDFLQDGFYFLTVNLSDAKSTTFKIVVN